MPAQKSTAISATEARALFSGLQAFPVLVLAVSGGPDSTALMVLAARWRDALKKKPTLIAVTVDHGLRKESKQRGGGGRASRAQAQDHAPHLALDRTQAVGRVAECRARGALSSARERRPQGRRRAHSHRTHARRPGGDSADPHEPRQRPHRSRRHDADGDAARRRRRLDHFGAAVARHQQGAADRNLARRENCLRGGSFESRSEIYTRASARLDECFGATKASMPAGWRNSRAVSGARRSRSRLRLIALPPWWSICRVRTRSRSKPGGLPSCPPKSRLRLLGRLVDPVGDEGPVELGKLEALKSALDGAQNTDEGRFRRTLAGAIVTLAGRQMIVERAPPRRRNLLTKRRPEPSEAGEKALEY